MSISPPEEVNKGEFQNKSTVGRQPLLAASALSQRGNVRVMTI